MPKSKKSSGDAAAKAAPRLDTPASLLGEAAAEIERLTNRCAQLEKIAELFGPIDDLTVVLNAAKAATFDAPADLAHLPKYMARVTDLEKKVADAAALLGEAMVEIESKTKEIEDLKGLSDDNDETIAEAAVKARDIIASKCEATLVDLVINEVMLEVDNPLREVWERLSPFDQARVRSKVADGVFYGIDAIPVEELAP